MYIEYLYTPYTPCRLCPGCHVQKKRRDSFDQIVIETTGLANPIPIINTLMAHQDLMDDIRLDGVVTLVDAKHVEQHLDDEDKSEEAVNEAVEQIAYADRILLNKVDLVSLLNSRSTTQPCNELINQVVYQSSHDSGVKPAAESMSLFMDTAVSCHSLKIQSKFLQYISQI